MLHSVITKPVSKLIIVSYVINNVCGFVLSQRPIYQPSGESDKENKRLEAPQSPSSSDRSLNDQPPPALARYTHAQKLSALLTNGHDFKHR